MEIESLDLEELELGGDDLEDNDGLDLDLNEVSFDKQTGGGFKEETNIVDYTIENNSDMDVSIDIGLDDINGGIMDLNSINLNSIDLNSINNKQNLNIDDTNDYSNGDVNVSNSSVKVIKIAADQNTLNMINK